MEEQNKCTKILKSGSRKGQECGRIKCQYHNKRQVEVVILEKKYARNVEGSSVDKKNWKKFWTKHTQDEYPRTCRAKDCERLAKATGHLFIRDMDEKYNYLVPICSHHNSCKYNEDYFLLKKNVKAVKIESILI
jgi:hypothetical protein